MSAPLKIAIVVGEHSGDVLGASLIEAIKKHHPDAEFFGIAGPRMLKHGMTSFFAMDELAVMGLVEILGRLPRLFKVRRLLIDDIVAAKPDVFVGIDAPEFNTGLELKLKAQGIKTVHYVSPSVWAWRQKRIFKIKAATDKVLALLPFEKKFYDQHQVPCDFVGHPLADEIPLHVDKKKAKQSLGLAVESKVVTIMPGSRGSELKMLTPAFMDAVQILAKQNPGLVFLMPMVDQRRLEQMTTMLDERNDEVRPQLSVANARECMQAADALLMSSGTATLEAMLCKTPMTVAYKVNGLTYQIAKRLVNIKYFSLPNLLADAPLVSEFMQDEVTPQALTMDVQKLLERDNTELLTQFEQLHKIIRKDASKMAAKAILEQINA